MPIEFQCDQCRNTLRVADEAAGKMARCPKCGHIGRVPVGSAAGSGPVTPPEAAPPPARPALGRTPPIAGGPFATGVPPWDGHPGSAGAGGANPYESPATVPSYPVLPGVYHAPTLRAIRGKVTGPGVALIVVGSLSMIVATLFCVVTVAQLMNGRRNEDWIVLAVFAGIMLLKGLPVIYGGIQMMRLRSFGAAMTGAIIALIPCFYCWLLELGFGIWAIVVLSDPFVRRAFQNRAEVPTGEGNPFGPQPR